MNATAMRNRFRQDAVATLSPSALVVALYDRLVVDCLQAEGALGLNRLDVASDRLRHAQDIVLALRTALDLEVWPAGRSLLAVYDFLRAELVRANVAKDPAAVAGVRRLVEELAQTWRQAAALVGS